jgi:hypothetical protein
MTEPHNSPDVWRDFRRRRRWHFGTLLGGVVAVPLVGASFDALFDSEAPFYIATAVWMVAILVSEVWLSLVKCPRCGRQFFRSFWFQHILLDECIHCHTRKYSTLDSKTHAA